MENGQRNHADGYEATHWKTVYSGNAARVLFAAYLFKLVWHPVHATTYRTLPGGWYLVRERTQ